MLVIAVEALWEIDEERADWDVGEGWPRLVVTVEKLVLKTDPDVTQMVLSQVVDWAGCTDDEVKVGGKMVPHSVGGELEGTSGKIVTVVTFVTVTVDVTSLLSVFCWLDASKAGADVVVICCTRSCEARSD